jgi:hypothetical protein
MTLTDEGGETIAAQLLAALVIEVAHVEECVKHMKVAITALAKAQERAIPTVSP